MNVARSMDLRANLRIVGALAGKDIVEGIKNRTTLTNLLMVFLVMVAYRAMPMWLDRDEPPRVFVYDAGDSALVADMERDAGLRLVEVDSEAELTALISEGDQRELALRVPAGYDAALDAGEPPVLEGTVVYWLGDRAVQEITARVEGELSRLAGAAIRIEIREERAYPEPEAELAGAGPIMASLVLVLGLVMVGVGVAPHLMFEEKQERTIDLLLVSPASGGQILVGKALAGLFYCLTVAAVILAFNAAMIVRWEMVLLTAFLASLFAVALGLLLGLVFDNRQQFVVWGFGLMAVLLLPVFLNLLAPLLPAAAGRVVRWIPTVALSRVAMAAGSPLASAGQFLPDLALVVGCTAALLMAVVWRLRSVDR